MRAEADNETTLQELKDLVQKFCEERHWGKHHQPKNLAMGIAIEAAELMEHYQWDDSKPNMEEVADELSDVLFNLLNLANHEKIDIAASFMKKCQKISEKYPLEIFGKDIDNLDKYRQAKQAYRARKP